MRGTWLTPLTSPSCSTITFFGEGVELGVQGLAEGGGAGIADPYGPGGLATCRRCGRGSSLQAVPGVRTAGRVDAVAAAREAADGRDVVLPNREPSDSDDPYPGITRLAADTGFAPFGVTTPAADYLAWV